MQYILESQFCHNRNRLSYAELRFEVVGKLTRLHLASAKTGKRMSLRKIGRTLEEAGHLNERGKAFNARSIKAMVER